MRPELSTGPIDCYYVLGAACGHISDSGRATLETRVGKERGGDDIVISGMYDTCHMRLWLERFIEQIYYLDG